MPCLVLLGTVSAIASNAKNPGLFALSHYCKYDNLDSAHFYIDLLFETSEEAQNIGGLAEAFCLKAVPLPDDEEFDSSNNFIKYLKELPVQPRAAYSIADLTYTVLGTKKSNDIHQMSTFTSIYLFIVTSHEL